MGIEGTGTAATQEAATQPETASVAVGSESSQGWNGEWETITKEPWYSGMPEEARRSFESGAKRKYEAWDRGYTQKHQGFAAEKKTLEERLAQATRQAQLYQDLASQDEQGQVKEWESRAREWEAKEVKYKADLEASEKRIRDEVEAKYKNKDTEHAKLKGDYDALFEYHKGIAAKELQAQFDKYPGLAENDRAMGIIDNLLGDPSIDLETAVRTAVAVVGGVKASPAEKPPKEVPPSVELASKGDGPARMASADEYEGLDYHMALRRAADKHAARLGET